MTDLKDRYPGFARILANQPPHTDEELREIAIDCVSKMMVGFRESEDIDDEEEPCPEYIADALGAISDETSGQRFVGIMYEEMKTAALRDRAKRFRLRLVH